MSKATKNLRDKTGLYIRDGEKKVYLTNPEKWRYSNGGELVIARVGSWSGHWTATWRAEDDSGQASETLIQWLQDNTKAAPMVVPRNIEKTYEEGELFRAALVASAKHVIETEGGLSGRATDEFIAQFNACAPVESEFTDDDKGHFIKQGSLKIYLPEEIYPNHELWHFRFGPTGNVQVAVSAKTQEDALDEAADWLAKHDSKFAFDSEALTKDKGKLRSFMRRNGMGGRFDDLSGKDQDIVLEKMAKDYVECHRGYLKKSYFKTPKHLKAGPLRRKLLALSDHMENHDEGEVDDTAALEALYGRIKKPAAPRRSSKKPATKKRKSKLKTKKRAKVKAAKPVKRRKLRGVVRRSDQT